VVEVAAESAAAAPAVAAITTSLVMAVEASGIKVTGLTNYHTVMSGAALKVATVQEAAAIKKILSKHPAVKQVYTAVSGMQSSQMPALGVAVQKHLHQASCDVTVRQQQQRQQHQQQQY
jgi:hypothetical protein